MERSPEKPYPPTHRLVDSGAIRCPLRRQRGHDATPVDPHRHPCPNVAGEGLPRSRPPSPATNPSRLRILNPMEPLRTPRRAPLRHPVPRRSSQVWSILRTGVARPRPARHPAIAGAFLPADRATTWNPGMMGAGGIPAGPPFAPRSRPAGQSRDDTAQIQAAINACPIGQVVQLRAGTFLINDGNFLLINKGHNFARRRTGPDNTGEDRRCEAIPGGRQRQSFAADHRRPITIF